MAGKFIGVKEKENVFCLKKDFVSTKTERAILKATALGVYNVFINGKRVGDEFMSPGWTSYKKSLQVQTYDVTDLIVEGENTIQFTVSQGWYCSGLAWNKECVYGEQSAVFGELDLGDQIIETDLTWQASTSYIRYSNIYDGETQDFLSPLFALTPIVIDYDKNNFIDQICEPIRNIERVPAKKVFITPRGERVYDFGQNLTGVVEITTPKDFEGEITLKFAEILVDGNFYTDNLRSAKATDVFRLKGSMTLSPEFTFHGFRYMMVEGCEFDIKDVVAIVRHSDMKRTGRITVDNKRFQRLLDNVVWGQRGNFFDIPSDCPQRDERLGWTGDINAFCKTATFNYDVRKVLKKWLLDARNDQAETGEIPVVIPDILNLKNTSAMWTDAITMVPWTLYLTYGDTSYLFDNYEAMKKFVQARENAMENGLINRGAEYGDWLALDKEELISNATVGRTDVYYLTNVLHTNTLKIVSKTAELLGKEDEQKLYEQKREELIKRIQNEYFTPSGRLALDTVTAQVVALHFDIVPAFARQRLVEELNKNVIKHNYFIATGFIGTTFLLFALADNGCFETARRVMMNNGYPGWLYEVDMGATTIWERWNSLLADGTPNPNGMNSYNHYAYGAMMEFVYRRIAGIEATTPGYEKVRIEPIPTKGLPKIIAEYESVRGKIVSGYEQKEGKIKFVVEIPKDVEAEIYILGEKVAEGFGKFEFVRDYEENLEIPPFTMDSTMMEVFQNPKSLIAFNEAFGEIMEHEDMEFLKNRCSLKQSASFLERIGVIKESEFIERLKKSNEIFVSLTSNID